MLIKIEHPSHWYERDGTPAYEVPRAKGGGTRPPTVADARKLDLVPSVTNIQNVLRKPALEAWKIEQGIMQALTLPRDIDESLDDFAHRVADEAGEIATKTAAEGTAIHSALEQWHRTSQLPTEPKMQPYVKAYQDYWSSISPYEAIIEKSFASPLGFGGRVDCHVPGEAVIDWKTRNTKPGQKVGSYETDGMQLAAYAMGLGMTDARLINVILSRSEPGRLDVIDWTDQGPTLWKMFLHCFELWKWTKNYDPSHAEPAQNWPERFAPVSGGVATVQTEKAVTTGQVVRLQQMVNTYWRVAIDCPEEPPGRVGDMVAVAVVDTKC